MDWRISKKTPGRAQYAVMFMLIFVLSVPTLWVNGDGEGTRLARVYATLQDHTAKLASPTFLVSTSARYALAQLGDFGGLAAGRARNPLSHATRNH